MPILKFRIYWEEDESIYRDILLQAGQTFLQLHEAILQSFDFDHKHAATFFRSNDHWQRGREILLEKDSKPRKAPPLIMAETMISDVLRNPNEKFVYVYDYTKPWTFLVELIAVTREGSSKDDYPMCIRKEGPAPPQYGNKKPVKDQMVETEEKYDLNNEDPDAGYGEEGEEGLPEDNGSGDATDANGTEDLF